MNSLYEEDKARHERSMRRLTVISTVIVSLAFIIVMGVQT